MNPEATKDCLDKDGFLHTGDVATYDQDKGIFYVVDRLKELIKVKGFQVAPAEIEALLVSHPDISDAAVIGIPSANVGGREGDGEAVKAFVVTKSEGVITEDQIKEWTKERVAAYKQIAAVKFVSKIPKSAAGKILRKDIRAGSLE